MLSLHFSEMLKYIYRVAEDSANLIFVKYFTVKQ